VVVPVGAGVVPVGGVVVPVGAGVVPVGAGVVLVGVVVVLVGAGGVAVGVLLVVVVCVSAMIKPDLRCVSEYELKLRHRYRGWSRLLIKIARTQCFRSRH